MRDSTPFGLASLAFALALVALATEAEGQDQTFATYIMEQQWHAVNQPPGVDR